MMKLTYTNDGVILLKFSNGQHNKCRDMMEAIELTTAHYRKFDLTRSEATKELKYAVEQIRYAKGSVAAEFGVYGSVVCFVPVDKITKE